MTKVQTHYRLQKPLDDAQFSSISGEYAIYGILKIRLDRSMDGLTVEYDATRLRPAEVESALARAGIPIELSAV
jgi:hypothetical protein